MYGTYNSDSLKYQQPVLIIVTVLIIERWEYVEWLFVGLFPINVENISCYP